jgi:hypothetical protein
MSEKVIPSAEIQAKRDEGAKAYREKRRLGLVPSPTDYAAQAKADPQNLRKAVKAKCWECCGGGQDPDTRATVRECQVVRCPLWAVRPFQDK